jgi:hypothetical protein
MHKIQYGARFNEEDALVYCPTLATEEEVVAILEISKWAKL